jgi:hypothetical protein
MLPMTGIIVLFSPPKVHLSNMDGFGDRNYVFLLQSYINLCPWLHNHFCTLLWSMQASPSSYDELNTSNTKSIRNQKPKIPSQLTLHSHNNFVTSEGCFSRSQYPLIYYIKGNYSRNYLSHKIITR